MRPPTAQELVDQLNDEAKTLAQQAQYELDHDDPDGAATAWAVLSVERRLAWLGVVLSTPGPHTGLVDSWMTPDPVREPVNPDGPRPPTVGDPVNG